jgi:hypothetical protein
MLRAHTVLDSGRVDHAVFGRRLVHAGVEWERWLQPMKRVVRIAPAVFVDIGKSSRGESFSDTLPHVDVGTGMVCAARCRRRRRGSRPRTQDGRMALSIGWRR